ncbi:hypothetical protein BT96DRAFT_344034 [Gymnopus androsaceus JB14]|uniref:Uncharacterized protein n=1 Tax=Gymnopus androsaceus JB14 TaxID=1447944 RepID=A0A6A4GZC4_9AGAR|nr:hypothetical protein BT96DRAFT_344034 [Gymnopus androsaceus JB14]
MTHGQPAPPPAQHTPPPPPPTLHQPQPQQQAQQQWSSENWPSHYSQHSAYPTQVQPQQQQQSSQPPLPSPVSSVPPESTYASRPDNSPALSSSGYDDRSTSLHHQSTMNGAQPKYRHGREEDSPPNYPNSHSQSSSPNPFATLDFDQLMKHIKFVETPIRERLAGIREPHLETLDQLIHAATYTAQMLDSAAGYTTSPSASNSYHPAPMSASQSYSNNRLSSPITRESNNRVEDTQSPHMHDNSPPLSASTPSLETEEYRVQYQ